MRHLEIPYSHDSSLRRISMTLVVSICVICGFHIAALFFIRREGDSPSREGTWNATYSFSLLSVIPLNQSSERKILVEIGPMETEWRYLDVV